MINALRGKVLLIQEDTFTIDVSGFGIEVFASRSLLNLAVTGEELSCFAYLQISDAGLNMFGFSTNRERIIFLELLQVKTVGGKLAITLLRHLDSELIISAIISGNPGMLTVPGLGSKRAERICFELKNKISKKLSDIADIGTSEPKDVLSDNFVIEALTSLGFSQLEAVRAISVSKANNEAPEAWTEENLIRAALNVLRRR